MMSGARTPARPAVPPAAPIPEPAPAPTPASSAPTPAPTGPSRWRGAARSLSRRPAVRLAVGYLATLALTAALADCLASDKPLLTRYQGELYLLPCLSDPKALRPHSLDAMAATLGPDDFLIAPPVPWGPNEQDKGQTALAPPSLRHPLGTDTARRDVLARIVHGTRVAALCGLLTVALYVCLGTLLGLLAGYYGGVMDALVSRLIEAVMAVPVLFLLLAILGVRERSGLGTIVVVLALVLWTRVARLVRAEARALRRREFIQAAEVLGFSPWRIMLRHMLPNLLAPVFVTAAFGVGSAILTESALSFLGFGAPDEVASWGSLLHGAMGHLGAWWLVLFPGLVIFLTVLALNLLGDALRDELDPRTCNGDT